MSLEDQFNNVSLSDLDDFITNRQEEHLLLDFKVVNKPDLSHRDDRKTLAKAISGFANSSGGLIVWGIDARENADGIDCAIGKQEIDPLPLFLSKLNGYTGQATSPSVDGVRHRGIISTGDKGFAVTLVPESDTGPHMAKLGEDRYYKRSGDSFYKMEHFDIEDMFGRRKKPELSLMITLDKVSARGNEVELLFLVTLKNAGRGSAKSPFLALHANVHDISEWQFCVDGNGHRGLNRISHSKGIESLKFGAQSDQVLHPGLALDVTKLTKKYRTRFESGKRVIGEIPINDIRIGYDLAAEDMALKQGEYLIKETQIRTYLKSALEH